MSEVKYKLCPCCGEKMYESTGGWQCSNCGAFETANGKVYPTLSLPTIEHDFDWQAFRVEAAKDFMSAIITREAPQYNFACRNVADMVTEAIMWADELIKQLKEDEKE